MQNILFWWLRLCNKFLRHARGEFARREVLLVREIRLRVTGRMTIKVRSDSRYAWPSIPTTVSLEPVKQCPYNCSRKRFFSVSLFFSLYFFCQRRVSFISGKLRSRRERAHTSFLDRQPPLCLSLSSPLTPHTWCSSSINIHSREEARFINNKRRIADDRADWKKKAKKIIPRNKLHDLFAPANFFTINSTATFTFCAPVRTNIESTIFWYRITSWKLLYSYNWAGENKTFFGRIYIWANKVLLKCSKFW